MKASRRSTVHPGISGGKVLLCVTLLCSVFQNTHQQDVQRTWQNFSRLFPSNSVYIQPRDEALATLKDSAAESPPLLEENNVVRSSNVGPAEEEREDEVEDLYSDEEYDESESQPEEALRRESKESRHDDVSKATTTANVIEKDTRRDNSSILKTQTDRPNDYYSEEPDDSSSTSQYDAYYYYEDYDNSSHPGHATKENAAAVNGGDGDVSTTFGVEDDDARTTASEEALPRITSTATELPTASSKQETPSGTSVEESSSEMVENVPSTVRTNADNKGSSMEGSDKHFVLAEVPAAEEFPDNSYLIGEAVVSVVTTKSVVNGTISVPVTPQPMTTEQILAPPTGAYQSRPSPSEGSETFVPTTENSRIVASVQTSRSISGARFLPFPVVEHVEEVSPNGKTPSPSESTESIIDKLDRVQSELSGGFLAGGFRSAGNALQLDSVLSEREQQTTRRSLTTTGKTPIITKFVPGRYNGNRKPTTPATSSTRGRTEITVDSLEGLLPPGYASGRGGIGSFSRGSFKRHGAQQHSTTVATTVSQGSSNDSTSPQRRTVSTKSGLPSTAAKSSFRRASLLTTTSASVGRHTPSLNVKSTPVQDISALLPPGYKLKKEEESSVTEKFLLNDILAKSKVDLSALLPPGYNEKKAEKNIETAKKEEPSATTAKSVQAKSQGEPSLAKKSLQDLFAKSEVDISSLLPRDFKIKTEKQEDSVKKIEGNEMATTESALPSTTKAAGGLKIVFPSRPGGRKPIYKITTPSSSRGEGPSANTPRIQKGWPTRATTEFTGWPTPSTTPISIEKLLEAARTATASTVNVSSSQAPSIAPTTSTTTTTTTTPRPTTPGICQEECELAGTIRIVGNTTWVPELLDRNTYEWQQLSNEVEREINYVFARSPVLKKWFKKIRIDSFSQGSILVDYFVELNDVPERVSTHELKLIFHDSLRAHNSIRGNDTNLMSLGTFVIDPKYTDFVVLPKVIAPRYTENDDRIIPQWAIAVIVIGVGGLLFIIVFGVSVLINRQNAAKLKPSISTMYEGEGAKNIINTSHAPPVHRPVDYHKADVDTMWNDIDAAWNDKSFESNSNKILVDSSIKDGRKYNLHDSWRSEWNGYYYNPSHTSSKFSGYDSAVNFSRHHPDYDTNF